MDTVTEKKHARLGPSGWDWWSNCPGAPALCDGLTRTSSIYADEGSVAHEVGDRVLSEEIADASELLGQRFTYNGHTFEVDDDMVEAVTQYVDGVRELIGEGILLPEQPVPVGHLTGEEGATGTADVIGIVDGGRKLVIPDFKYGMGVRVNAEGNGQGRMYALGVLEKFKAIYDEIEEVEIWIFQTRLEHGTTHETLSIGELEEFKDIVEIAAGRVALNDANFTLEGVDALELNPGEKQCKFCPAANGHCPALNAEIAKGMSLLANPSSMEDFMDLTVPKQAAAVIVNEGVTSARLAEFLRAVPLIEAAITAARAEAERRLFLGEEVPGFYLGIGRKGHRKWADEEAAKKAIVKRGKLTKEQAFTQKLISPTKAEKLLGKDTIKVLQLEGVIVQPDGKPSVCMDGDKNERYVPVTAEDFADLSSAQEQQLQIAEAASGMTREQAMAPNKILDDIQWVSVDDAEAQRLLS